jgi:hypothetical protein
LIKRKITSLGFLIGLEIPQPLGTNAIKFELLPTAAEALNPPLVVPFCGEFKTPTFLHLSLCPDFQCDS